MKSNTLSALAASALGLTIWLWSVMYEPGTQLLAGLGAGLASMATVRLVMAAVRADARERKAR